MLPVDKLIEDVKEYLEQREQKEVDLANLNGYFERHSDEGEIIELAKQVSEKYRSYTVDLLRYLITVCEMYTDDKHDGKSLNLKLTEKDPVKNCTTCRFLDEYFHDCCHPDGGGVSNMAPSMDNCLAKNGWKWWRPKKNPVKDLIENIDDGIDLDKEGV